MSSKILVQNPGNEWQSICGCKFNTGSVWSGSFKSGDKVWNGSSWVDAFCPVGVLVVDIFSNTTIQACAYINNLGATIPYLQATYTSRNFFPNDGTLPENCYILASDLGSGTVKFRFEFNIQLLQEIYPSETILDLRISGRDISSGFISGSYGLKGFGAGQMTMIGSSPNFIPTTQNAVNLGSISYSGKAVVSGANGAYGIGVGADILVFTYTVATGVISLA